MIKANYLKEKLESGKNVIGTWSIIPSAITADIISNSAIDFQIIDKEHGHINFEDIQNKIIACESNNVSPVIRVSGLNASEIQKALDIGPHCIHVPNITNAVEAKKAVMYAKYPPIGIRGFSPFTRLGNYTKENTENFAKNANENILLAIHIEGKEAINEINEILKINGIDIIFIGLYDISKSLGILGKVNDIKVIGILREIAKKAEFAGKYPGTIVTDLSKMKQFMEYGIKYMTFSVDCEILLNAYKYIVKEFRVINNV